MAVIHMDSMDTYTAIGDVVIRYPSASAGATLSATTGRFGGPCSYPSSPGLPLSIPHTGSNPIIVGGVHMPSTTASGYSVISFWNSTFSTNTAEFSLWYENGVFRIYRGNGNVLAASSALTYPASIWHHIEIKLVVADSGGTCEVRINGVVAINFTGDTRQGSSGTAGVDKVIWSGATTTVPTGGAWDDIYILDHTGSVSNNFIGDCRISTLAPTSDSSVQFTRSTGASNYLCIDEIKYNGDSDYVESSTVGHVDMYGYPDVAASVSTVHAVQAISWAKKTDAATRTFRNLITSSGTTLNGTTTGLTTSYTPITALATVDPATSAQWTVSAVNALTAGFEVVA